MKEIGDQGKANSELLKIFLEHMNEGCILIVIAGKPNDHAAELHLVSNICNQDILEAMLADTLETFQGRNGKTSTDGYAKA